MAERSLLQYLSDGDYHSGEELGQLLGVSRTAVWKQINKLNELGVSVESVKSRGYRIAGGLDLLKSDVIQAQLSESSSQQLSALSVELSIASTNAMARETAEVQDATGLAIFAEQQTDGRGRRGRNWISPFGRNLYFSLVWGFDTGVEAVEGLSLAVGVAVCRSAKRCHINGLQLKWPNDLLWQGHKVGGILLEMIGDPAGFCQVVIGIGLNVGMDDGQAADIDQPWANLNQITEQPIQRSVLAGCVLDELLILLSDYESVGFADCMDEWLQRDAFADQPVKLIMVSREIIGIARGVSATGALRLEVDGEVVEYSGGEISMRGQS